ncbi:hypothetical protein BDR04DRAFT_1164515 [Suillus decipiens]|nr:hypothetical protein BDR04DRAFT_1164515 [Suillus decipiens]
MPPFASTCTASTSRQLPSAHTVLALLNQSLTICLLDCPHYRRERHTLACALGRKATSLPYLLPDSEATPHLVKYVNATGRLRPTFVTTDVNTASPATHPLYHHLYTTLKTPNTRLHGINLFPTRHQSNGDVMANYQLISGSHTSLHLHPS